MNNNNSNTKKSNHLKSLNYSEIQLLIIVYHTFYFHRLAQPENQCKLMYYALNNIFKVVPQLFIR